MSEKSGLRPWPSAEENRSASRTTDSDATSMNYSYFSVDSTNMTMSDLPGPGRLLGNLYSRLGRSLEHRICSASAKRQGADPREVGVRIRSMALWKCQEEDTSPFKQHVLSLSDLNSHDEKLLRRCCRALLYYTSTYQSTISALHEIIDLSMKYFPVRETFAAIRAEDALRLLPLVAKQFGHRNSPELCDMEALVEKAQLCLRDNKIYSACRDSFLLPSWSQDLHGVELRVMIEPFLSSRGLHSIAADLVIFFELEAKLPDPQRIGKFVLSLFFWKAYGHKRNAIEIQDLDQKQADILMRCCKILLAFVNQQIATTLVSALEVIIKLSRQYRSIRDAFTSLDATGILHRIAYELRDQPLAVDDAQDLIAEACFSLQDNEVYKLVRHSTSQVSWTPEVEGAVLRLDLERFLAHSQLKDIASVYIDELGLSSSTYYTFISYAGKLIDPHWREYEPAERRVLSSSRACLVLIKYATESSSPLTRVEACSYIEEMIFRHPPSMMLLIEMDLSGRLAKADHSAWRFSPDDDHTRIDRYLERRKRLMLCFQNYDVFPQSIAYFKELDRTLLELILDCLRSPELFFIGAKVLSQIWLKVLFLSEDLLTRVVVFLLDTYKEIAHYPEAEPLIVAILENTLFEQRLRETPLGTTWFPAVCMQLTDTLSSTDSQALYPRAFAIIEEYRGQILLDYFSRPNHVL